MGQSDLVGVESVLVSDRIPFSDVQLIDGRIRVVLSDQNSRLAQRLLTTAGYRVSVSHYGDEAWIWVEKGSRPH